MRTSGRARKGRGRSGSRRRSRITASCARVNARRTPKEYVLARSFASSPVAAATSTIPIATTVIAAMVSRETSVWRSSRPISRGSMPCVPIECARRAQPEIDVVIAIMRMSADESPTAIREHVDEIRRELALERRHDPDERGLEPLRPELGRAVLGAGNAVTPTTATSTVRRRRARSRRRASGAACGPARAPPRRGSRPSRGRCRRGTRAGSRRGGRRASPGRARGTSPSTRVDGENRSARPSTTISDCTSRSRSATTSAGRCSRERRASRTTPITAIAETRDDDVPRRVAERVGPERRADVVRQEQRGERDHDQVVEEERPAGDEAGEVVVRAPRERLGAAGLGDRRGPLGVRERDEPEDDARDGEDDGRQPERRRGDDPERDVDRRARSPRTRSRRAPARRAPARSRGPSGPSAGACACARAGSARRRARRTGRRARTR